MSVDTLVGLQQGSEGKGKFAGLLAPFYQASVRVGAPNAGHTVIKDGTAYKMRVIPCAWVSDACNLFVGGAGMVNVDLLMEELAMLPTDIRNRFFIDRNTGILTEEDKQEEEREQYNKFNGSTAEGCGVALAKKVRRIQGTIAAMEPRLARYVVDAKQMLWEIDDHGGNILLEGTQGYGLSISHGPYPYVTSRDVLSASLLSDVGFAPKACRYTLGVMRTYPIRVAGNSGPMGSPEITWADVTARAGYPEPIEERTTVTKRVRRVFEQDWTLLEQACRANQPDGVFISFIDYIDANLCGKSSMEDFLKSEKAVKYVDEVRERLKVDVLAISTGPAPEHTILLPKWRELFQ